MANITLDRLQFKAIQFLQLQAEAKMWIESVLGRELATDDLYKELKDGRSLCELVNKLFPGAILTIHKSNFAAHQLENINFFLTVLNRLGLRDEQLFSPDDLQQKKNMLRVMKALSSLAQFVCSKGCPYKWKRQTDTNFSWKQIDKWKQEYGHLEDGGDPNEELDPNTFNTAVTISEPVQEVAAPVVVAKAVAKEKVEDDAEGNTPLHYATLKGDLNAVRDLIRKGMNVDTTNARGWTPLYTAAYTGNQELLRFFISQGADVNCENEDGWTPLFAAVAQGHKECVEILVREHNAAVNILNNQGTSPLYHSCYEGRYKITKLLLDAGADTELSKEGEWKPIHGAVYNYHSKVTRLLVDAGAHLNVRNRQLKDYAPLHIAISTKKPSVEILKMLLEKGADVNLPNENDSRPIHLAALWGHTEIAGLLITSGCDINAKNNKGRTALEVAARNGFDELAKLLSEKSGKPIPKVKAKKTKRTTIATPDAPPPPPDADD